MFVSSSDSIRYSMEERTNEMMMRLRSKRMMGEFEEGEESKHRRKKARGGVGTIEQE